MFCYATGLICYFERKFQETEKLPLLLSSYILPTLNFNICVYTYFLPSQQISPYISFTNNA